MTGPRRNAAARWLPTPSPTARRLRYTSTPTPTMPSMLPLCSPAAARLVTWSNTTSLPPRMRKKRRAHSLPLISPGHHPSWETNVRVDPLVRSLLGRPVAGPRQEIERFRTTVVGGPEEKDEAGFQPDHPDARGLEAH